MMTKKRNSSAPTADADSLQRENTLVKRWTSLAAFLLVLLFAGAADGLMEALGPGWFLAVGLLVMGLSRALERIDW